MKKSFSSMNKQQGFILPYIMVFITVMLLLVTASAHIYRNEVYVAKQATEQLRLHTVFQMGLAKFRDEHMNDKEKQKTDTIVYVFPDGETAINYTVDEKSISLSMDVSLNESSIKKSFRRDISRNHTE